MPATQPIRIGIIGAGANTRSKHIPGLKAIEGVEVAGVCNRSDESSRKVAAEFSIPRTYAHWTELAADPELDAVVIGTWPYLHCPATVAALEAGKHVLCEARMAMDAAEARRMFEAARVRPHLIAQLVPAPFTFRVDATVMKMLAEGYIGTPLAIDVHVGNAFSDPAAPMQWRNDADLSGYNTMSLGIYFETVLRWLGEARSVAAMGKVFTKLRKDEVGNLRAVRIPEHLDVIADLACGAQLHMQISAVTGLAPASQICLFGSEGTLCIEGSKLLGGRKGEKSLKEIPIAPELEGRWRVEEEFINAIRGQEKVARTPFAEGVKYMDFTEAVARSIATGQRIALPLQ